MRNFYKSLFSDALRNIVKNEKKIKKSIENQDVKKQLFWLHMRRFISNAKAILLLCEKKHNLEAVMLLRPMIELVVNLRWMVEDKTNQNIKKFFEDIDYEFDDYIPKMGDYWADADLLKRMKAIGFDEYYYKMVVKKLHEELHCNPGVIARSHHRNLTALNSEAIFATASQFVGHLLKVGNDLYPHENFINHTDIWSKIKYDKKHYNKRFNA